MNLYFMFLVCVGALPSCNGQFTNKLFPTFTKISREILNIISKNPTVINGTEEYGNLVAKIVENLTKGPIENKRRARIRYGLQELDVVNNKYNTLAFLDKYIIDATKGLKDGDVYLDIRCIIRKHGFKLEEYKVVTEDGYILTLFRIPGSGSPILVQHGILESADDFFTGGRYVGIGFLLADDDYDVWIGNSRGNKHSRNHTHLDPKYAEFWDFDWHEMGIYDLPAMIDFILNKTGATAIKYIGHSQGNTEFFVMTSLKPDYNDKVSIAIALSPIAFIGHVKSPIVRLMTTIDTILYAFLKTIGYYEFAPDNNLMRTLKFFACGFGPVSDILCSNIVFMFGGIGYAQINFTALPVIESHLVSGCSAKQLAHYGQNIVYDDFSQFDYGFQKNLKLYGSKTAPRYPLGNIRTPVAMVYSTNDWLSQEIDVNRLRSKLNNVVAVHVLDHFSHFGYLWGRDIKALLYPKIKQLIDTY